MTKQIVASPSSTGGAGTFFEQHVAAYWLAQLLVRAVPPILIETNVVEASFQTEHLGWKTDDFLIICEGGGAARRVLAGQVKRGFTVSAADEDCVKTFLDFWQDYRAPDRFAPTQDRLVLVVQRATGVLLNDLVGLFDCARASRDAAGFQKRLSTQGLLSKKARHYCEEICKIVGAHESRAVSASELWPFLCALHVLSLDLDTSTKQTEAHIKTLLAYTATSRDPSSLAQTSWNSLLAIAGTAMSHAGTLRWQDLPGDLRRIHGALSGNEERMLRSLKEHTAPVLKKIRSTIGTDFHLERGALVQSVMDEFESAQVVIVSGPAGCGKSAIGKDVAVRMANDHFVFGFRVEEFAQPHIDAVLNAAQIPGNAEALAAILSAQTRKFVLIESVERLLEKTTRDAFSDLMLQASADPDMRLVLTCRDYSTEQVRDSFLRPSGLSHSVITIPALDDAELTEVSQAVPALAEPLKNDRLRNILRNPYFLDKAIQIPWADGRPVPESERDFRLLFWRQVVRDESGLPLGMARRREDALQQIAVHRARALSEYVSTTNLDPEVVASLKRDSLIASPENSSSLVATAHDVLEDWAILQWLDELQQANTASLQALSTAIGTHPAIRRSYRKWLAELLEREPASADRLFVAVTSGSGASAQFRHDTLVSLLKAPLAPELLLRHETEITANDNTTLRLIIHLLRVACVATPDWLHGASGQGSLFNVPEGPAWTAVLKLVHDGLQRFTAADHMLLLGLVEDAVRGVSWWAPDLNGAELVGGIGYTLLPEFDNYRSEGARRRLLKVIVKIPRADPIRFESVLRGKVTSDRSRDLVAEELQDILFTGPEGSLAARYLPELIASVATEYLLQTDEALQSDEYHSHSIDIDIHFGVKDLRHEFLPASAIRGPWIPLLRHHPRVGLELYFKVFNYSIDWYVHPRASDPLEPAWETELRYADGTTIKQWGNGRLWNCYRGVSVSPYVLQSMLMALEMWLLEVAEARPGDLDRLLLRILRNSQSASLSAVVASVATAHPRLSGEALLVLLSAPDFIHFDGQRMASESRATSLNRMFPDLQADKKLYREERERANALPHRKHDLEGAIANLQLGPLAPRVHELIDRHLAALPKGDRRNQSDLVWQLALQRMDLRQYTISEATDVPSDSGAADNGSGVTYVRLEPKAGDPDVRAMVEESASKVIAMNNLLAVWMWGVKAFKRENSAEEDNMWRDKLTAAGTIDRESGDDIGGRNGPGVVAAVCVRDHWPELTDDERVWCSDVVCAEILRNAEHWNHTERVQRFDMAADRLCASVVPLLLTKKLSDSVASTVRFALAAAITHPIEEVRWFATWGVNEEVWQVDRAAAIACISAIAEEAGLLEKAWENARRRFWKPDEAEAIFSKTARQVRRYFWRRCEGSEDVHAKIDPEGQFGNEASARILTILSFASTDPLCIAAFERASQALVSGWDEDEKDGGRRSRRYENEQAIADRIEKLVVQTTPEHALRILRPILDAVDRHPREIYSMVQGLTVLEDRHPRTPQYWYLWGLFAEKVKAARWLAWLDRRHPTGSEMLAAIFMTSWWKDDVRHWKSLEGYAHHVDALFEALPPTSIVLDDYLSFLYHIGERSLPQAFIRIAHSIQRGNATQMLAKSNTVFLLEVVLQRHVYGRPLELKQSQDLRDTVFYLLDVLVENGSSAAFRMRDDFVTPVA